MPQSLQTRNISIISKIKSRCSCDNLGIVSMHEWLSFSVLGLVFVIYTLLEALKLDNLSYFTADKDNTREIGKSSVAI